MIKEVNSIAYAATAIGFMNLFNAAVDAVSEPLTGKFLDMNWTGLKDAHGVHQYSVGAYHLSLSVMPIYLVVAIVLLVLIKDSYNQR